MGGSPPVMLLLAAPFVSVPPFQIGGLSVRSLRGLWVTPSFTLCLGGRADGKKRKEKIRKRRVVCLSVWSGLERLHEDKGSCAAPLLRDLSPAVRQNNKSSATFTPLLC